MQIASPTVVLNFLEVHQVYVALGWLKCVSDDAHAWQQEGERSFLDFSPGSKSSFDDATLQVASKFLGKHFATAPYFAQGDITRAFGILNGASVLLHKATTRGVDV